MTHDRGLSFKVVVCNRHLKPADHPTGTALYNAHDAKNSKLRHINFRFAPTFWKSRPECNGSGRVPPGPIFLAAKPAQRGTTWLKPVAKGRNPVIPYPRWPKNDF